MSKEDAVREERILMEIVVDAYGQAERAMGWYYYLADKVLFAFDAECVSLDKRSPLVLGEQVEVLDLSGEDYCENEVYVDVRWNDRVLAVPLSQLRPVDADEDTVEAVEDWHYWCSRGYSY